MRVLQGDEENELGDVEGHREAGHAAVAAGSPEVRARNDTCYIRVVALIATVIIHICI